MNDLNQVFNKWRKKELCDELTLLNVIDSHTLCYEIDWGKMGYCNAHSAAVTLQQGINRHDCSKWLSIHTASNGSDRNFSRVFIYVWSHKKIKMYKGTIIFK